MFRRVESEEQANRMISGVVEEVMSNIFGRKALCSILQFMREKYGLDLDEVPNKPQLFSEAMRKIIGVGSIVIEDLIIENLYVKIGLNFRWKKGYSFPDYINEIKNIILSNSGGCFNYG